MVNFKLLFLVFKDFKHKKFSSFLTLFAISLGILTIFMIFILSVSFETSIEKQFEQFGSNRLYVSPADASFGSGQTKKDFDDSVVKFIESKPYVDEVYKYYLKTVELKFSNEVQAKALFGLDISEDYFKDVGIEIDKGRIPKSNEKYSVLLGPKVAEDLFDKEMEVGSNIYVEGVKFKVVGILESVGNSEDDSNIYVNIDTLRDLTDGGDLVSFIDVAIILGEDVKLAEENLKIALDNRLGEDRVAIITPAQILDQLGSILDIVKYSLGGIALVSLLVGALGIINTMFVIVTEKVKDIGILKSIGASNASILFLFAFQAGFYGFLGGVLGLIFGVMLSFVFESGLQSSGFGFFEIQIDTIIVLGLLAFSFFIGVVAGLLPSYKASKMNIVEALRK